MEESVIISLKRWKEIEENLKKYEELKENRSLGRIVIENSHTYCYIPKCLTMREKEYLIDCKDEIDILAFIQTLKDIIENSNKDLFDRIKILEEQNKAHSDECDRMVDALTEMRFDMRKKLKEAETTISILQTRNVIERILNNKVVKDGI